MSCKVCERQRARASNPLKMTERQRLDEIASIIEGVDNRLLACDGPVGDWQDEATDAEWKRIYRLAKARGKSSLQAAASAIERTVMVVSGVESGSVRNVRWRFTNSSWAIGSLRDRKCVSPSGGTSALPAPARAGPAEGREDERESIKGNSDHTRLG